MLLFFTIPYIFHDMTIGKHLKTLRNNSGLSFRKLAAQVGISHNNLAVYERDVFGPSLENAVKIANYFKVPVEYLLYGQKAEFRYHDLELVELFGKADELPTEYREMVKDYIRQVVVHSEERTRLLEKSRTPTTEAEQENRMEERKMRKE